MNVVSMGRRWTAVLAAALTLAGGIETVTGLAGRC